MPLLDHFRPPLSARRHWHAFHNAWATSLAADLNQRLPEGYFAEPNVQFGIEIDVAALEEAPSGSDGIGRPEFATATAPTGGGNVWEVPAPTQTVPISIITDIVEVVVFDREGGPTLAAAIELVSPANKDRPAHRNAFVYKCAAYLQQGIGLILVDVVTDRKTNLHDELLARIGEVTDTRWEAELYAAAYRPVLREGEPNLDIWREAMAVGRSLPTLPLWLRGGLSFPVNLDATYTRTCQELRVTAEAA